MKYVVEKIKGAFYAGSEKIAKKGLKLRRYATLQGVKRMANSLHLSASSIVFKGLNRDEQKKILSSKSRKPAVARKKPAKKKAGRR